MCNCLITEDSCRPTFKNLERKQFSYIFCYTFVCELFQTKHKTYQIPIFSPYLLQLLPIDKTAASQLVTWSTRHRSARHPVDSSSSRLVTKRRSTRHKQTSKHQSRTAAAVITLTRSPTPLLKKMHKKLSRKQSEQQSTRSVLLTALRRRLCLNEACCLTTTSKAGIGV